MQILWTIHIGNVWVMLWELIATSAIVWTKYKMPCSPVCTSYLWAEFEGRTFTLITFRSERNNYINWLGVCVYYKCTICFFVSVNFWLISVSFTSGQSLFYPAIIVPHKPVYYFMLFRFLVHGYTCLTCHCLLLFQLVSSGTYTQPLKVQSAGKNAGSITVSMKMVLCTFCHYREQCTCILYAIGILWILSIPLSLKSPCNTRRVHQKNVIWISVEISV